MLLFLSSLFLDPEMSRARRCSRITRRVSFGAPSAPSGRIGELAAQYQRVRQIWVDELGSVVPCNIIWHVHLVAGC